jgi:hypothetical protein
LFTTFHVSFFGGILREILKKKFLEEGSSYIERDFILKTQGERERRLRYCRVTLESTTRERERERDFEKKLKKKFLEEGSSYIYREISY